MNNTTNLKQIILISKQNLKQIICNLQKSSLNLYKHNYKTMKYSIESIAASIAASIEFENELMTFDDLELNFDNCDAWVDGYASAYETTGGDMAIYNIEVARCRIMFHDGDETVFNVAELKELERNVKIYY